MCGMCITTYGGTCLLLIDYRTLIKKLHDSCQETIGLLLRDYRTLVKNLNNHEVIMFQRTKKHSTQTKSRLIF